MVKLYQNYLSLSLGIGGLAIGIAAFIISILFINNELSFDGFIKIRNPSIGLLMGKMIHMDQTYTAFVMVNTLKKKIL